MKLKGFAQKFAEKSTLLGQCGLCGIASNNKLKIMSEISKGDSNQDMESTSNQTAKKYFKKNVARTTVGNVNQAGWAMA